MNVHEHFTINKRRKTESENLLKEKLNFSRLNNYNKKRSISTKKVNIYNDNIHNNSVNMNNHHNIYLDKKRSKKNLIYNNKNNKSFSSRINSDNNRFFNINDNRKKRNSYQFLNTQIQKLFKRYNVFPFVIFLFFTFFIKNYCYKIIIKYKY